MKQEVFLNGLVNVRDNSSDITVLCFSGPMSGERFPFFRSFDSMNVNTVFVKEHSAGWFQYGLPEAEGHAGLLSFLKDLLGSLNTKKLYCFGSSMGGYAALLYGSLLNATRILTFGARTYVHPTYITNSKIIQDKGANKDIQRIFSLVRDYARSGGGVINVCGEDEWLDVFHIARLTDIENITNLTVLNAGHNVGAWLKEYGILNDFLVAALINGNIEKIIPLQGFLFENIKARNLVVEYIKKYKNQDYTSAQSVVAEAIELYPTWAIAFQKAVLVAMHLKQYEKALEYSNMQLKLDSNLIKGAYSRGRLMICLGRWDEAIDLLKLTLNTKPTLGSPLAIRCVNRCLAYAFNKNGDVAMAQQYFDSAFDGLKTKLTDANELSLEFTVGI